MPRHVIGHASAERVSANAGSPEVDAAEDARVGDFIHGACETGERAGARSSFRIHSKRRVFAKYGSENERSGTAKRSVCRRVFWVRGSAGFEEIEPGLPSWIRIGRSEPFPDYSNGAPENEPIFGIPAGNGGIRHCDIQQG